MVKGDARSRKNQVAARSIDSDPRDGRHVFILYLEIFPVERSRRIFERLTDVSPPPRRLRRAKEIKKSRKENRKTLKKLFGSRQWRRSVIRRQGDGAFKAPPCPRCARPRRQGFGKAARSRALRPFPSGDSQKSFGSCNALGAGIVCVQTSNRLSKSGSETPKDEKYRCGDQRLKRSAEFRKIF